VNEARIVTLGAAARQAHVAGPRVARVVGALDEERLESPITIPEDESDCGRTRRSLDGALRTAMQTLANAIERKTVEGGGRSSEP
jgi:hypothetical protein